MSACAKCGAPLDPSRRRFCSTRCSRNFHKAVARQRERETRARQRELEARLVALVREFMAVRRDHGELVNVELLWRYRGWGRNEHRPYGFYIWVDGFTVAVTSADEEARLLRGQLDEWGDD